MSEGKFFDFAPADSASDGTQIIPPIASFTQPSEADIPGKLVTESFGVITKLAWLGRTNRYRYDDFQFPHLEDSTMELK